MNDATAHAAFPRTDPHDVIVLGGGLAGLSLAIQLRRADPSLDVLVLERRAGHAPEAAFKVGESTVEIGAHYFANVLGLREHLDREHLRKFGFRFFFSDGRADIDRCTELGVSRVLPTPSWQIDRGRLENFLVAEAARLGVRVVDAATVRRIDLRDDDAPHRVDYEHDGTTHGAHARWVVDASGRAGLLKRKLDLDEDNGHDANAVWWRVEGHIDPNDWSDDPDWHARCTPPDRWRSTNHMCGEGYWFWLIPLASGAHSLGIVCDARLHPLETMKTHEQAMAWLRTHQPRVAATLDAPEHALMDFRYLRGFSHGCRQVFSADRWALTGEAGVFLDPFYSPGSDFIGIANTYIADLILRDRAGQPFAPYATLYQQIYFSFYENTMTLYRDQYPIFGDALVMPLKVIWDYTYYWALLAPLACGGRLTDVAMLGRLRPQFERGRDLNLAMQSMLRDWAARRQAAGTSRDGDTLDDRLLDQARIDWFHEMNRALHDALDDDAFAAQIRDNVARMDMLANELTERMAADARMPCVSPLPVASVPMQVSAPSLSPVWYAAG